MPFGAIIRPGVIRPFSLIRISPISWACYHKVPSNSTNGSLPIYVAPSFPDDFESSPLASEGAKIGKEIPKWDESQATFSEAAVKADRGDVNLNPKPRTKTPTTEDRVPELDEM